MLQIFLFHSSYRCSLYDFEISREDFEIDEITGQHVAGYSAKDVTQIWFWTGNYNYIPNGIGKVFNSLQQIWVTNNVNNLRLRVLQRRNFLDMPNLIHVNVNFNEIERIDEETFWDVPHLLRLMIKDNKIKTLHKSTFVKNLKLTLFFADDNQIEALPKELFENNLMLHKVSLKGNKLMEISVDFTLLTKLEHVDLSENICTSQSFMRVENTLEDFQTIVNASCGA